MTERPPSIDAVARKLSNQTQQFPHPLVVAEIRRVLERVRTGELTLEQVEEEVLGALRPLAQPSLRRVINATGVVLHTNLGRAPLGAVEPVYGYSNLEYDLETGRRGKRDSHYTTLIERLFGTPGIAVNNNATAVFLVLNELAAGHEVIISRGELIEIGDGFRIPDIVEKSGAIVREVGATNRTSIEDYRAAINGRTRLILRVHPSNFHISGFTAKPTLAEIAALGRQAGLHTFEDLGSGCVADLKAYGIDEPIAGDSLKAGIDLISFSCDKLLGGPQTGIITGQAELIQRLRRNPLYRAFRCDKLIVRTLEQSLRRLLLERYDEVPALWMIRRPLNELKVRAQELAEALQADVIPGESLVGGGSTPEQSLPSWLIALRGDPREWEPRLRRNNPPIIARIQDDKVVLDLRTVFPEEESEIRAALIRRD